MAPLPPVANCLKVALGWSADNDTGALTILHFRYTGGPPTSAQCVSMAAAFSAAQAARFASLLNEQSSIGECVVTDLTSSTSGQGAGGATVAGTRAGSELSAGTAALVNLHIARRYRGGKGRSYLPLGVAGDITTGRWTSAFETAVFNAYTDFQSDALGVGVGCTIASPCLASYRLNGAARNPGVTEDVLSWTTQPLVASQRRRNRNQ